MSIQTHLDDNSACGAAGKTETRASTKGTKMTRERRLTEIDAAAGTLTVSGIKYSRAELSQSVLLGLATIGLQALLTRATDPAAVFANLQQGIEPWAKKPKADPYPDWQKAWAAHQAIKTLQAVGTKVRSGQHLHNHPDFTAAYEGALSASSPWTRERTNAARGIPGVVAEHARITGVTLPDDEFFTAPPAPMAEQPAAELVDEEAGEAEEPGPTLATQEAA